MDRHHHRHDPPLTESDIQAYADGLLAPERAAHLRSYLGDRPGEARRVAFYGRLNEQIQRTFQPEDEPLPLRESGMRAVKRPEGTSLGRWFAQRVGTLVRRPLRAALLLITALVLAAAAVSGWMVASQLSQQALNNAAVMALEQDGGPHGAVASAAATPGAMVAGGSGDSISNLNAPDLSSLGMRLVSRRTLKPEPFASATEFVYLNAKNQPVVLLTAQAWFASAEPQWSARRIGTLRLLTWNAHHQRYVLAGAADTRGLMLAADRLTLQ